MRVMAFAERNRKEILRDPTTLIFGVGMPILMLAIVKIIGAAIPGGYMPANFQLDSFVPATALFGMSFITMFTGMLISRDRATSYLTRLFAGPMLAWEYILGYTVPMVPIALAQSVMTLGIGLVMGLTPTWGILWAMLMLTALSLLFLALGLLLGAGLTDKQLPAIASIVVQVVALTSGMWFDLGAMGGGFATLCNCLPFRHALQLAVGALRGDLSGWPVHAAVLLAYTAAAFVLATLVFKRKMKQ